MKTKGIPVCLSNLEQSLYRGSAIALALLFAGLLVTSVSAKSTSSPPFQGLPTRPAAPQPTSPPPEPQPSPSHRPDEGPPPASTPTSTTVPRPAGQITATQEPALDVALTQSVDLTFEELGYGTLLFSESGWRRIGLYLPRSFVPNSDGSYLDLTISHAPPEPDKQSVIKATFNDVPLAVITLSPENAELTTYRFYLEDAPLTSGRNVLKVSLDTGGWCSIRGAAVDLAVHSSSSFHLEYSLTQYAPDLALYPVPFFEQSFESDPVYVVLPENPSATDLSAAATVAAGLGKASYGEVALNAALDTQVSADVRNSHHLILIGKRGENRLLDQLDLPLALDDSTLSDEQGVIQELVSPWNPLRMILVVTGGSDEGLFKASQALNREVHLLGMRGPVAIVQAVLPPDSVESAQRDADFTLADLGYEEELVYGTRPQTLDYHFYMPLAWTVTEEPRFTLYFGHAEAASPTNSSLDVYFDDVPVGSVLLDESNASEGSLEVKIPSWLIRSGRNDIRVSIEMNLDDEDKCLFLDSQHLWAVIYSHSFLHLPFVAQDAEPSLDLFPYPFNKRPSLSGVLLVLPDHPRQFDCDLMVEVAAGLGAADRGDFLALDVATAGLVDQEDHREKDLVLIGRPTAHSLIAELNDSLPQPFEPGSDRLQPQLESVVFVQTHSRSVGLIEELATPWDPERIILVLTGTTDDGVALAGVALLYRSDRLAGNLAVVEESMDKESIDVQAFDTRPLDLLPEGQTEVLDPEHDLLIQLGEWWW